MAPQIKRATKFNRIFDPEFLQTRKDITPLELACAQGKTDEVVAGIKEDENIIFKKNRDGNTLLLFAIANVHVQLAHFLLEMRSNVLHKNAHKLDALDYAVMDNVRSPMAKIVLAQCDYIVTECFEGPYEKPSIKVLADLTEKQGLKLARTTLFGKKPEFGALFGRETDYRKEWVSNFKYVANLVKKGVLLLSDDIEYLERDALLTGALEISMATRYLYSPEKRTITKFTDALKGGTYESAIEARLVQTSSAGDSMAVQGLLKAKCTPNFENMRGESVLHCSCHNGDPQTIKCLLVAKAAVNATNKDGYSPLHVAACRNNGDAVSVLLKAKADLFARSHKGNSVLDFVKHEGHKETLDILQEERSFRKEEWKREAAANAKTGVGGYLRKMM